MSCTSANNELNYIEISGDQTIKGLTFKSSTAKDFIAFAYSKGIDFKLDTIPLFSSVDESDTLEICGNDSRFYEKSIKFSNDSLGLIFNFYQFEGTNEFVFNNFMAEKFNYIKFLDNQNGLISVNELLPKFESVYSDSIYNYYKFTNMISYGILKTQTVNDSTQKMTSFSISANHR